MEKFHQNNKDYLSHNQEEASVAAKTFFAAHDIAHVLFGCDITLFGEGAVKTWTIFGTTLGFWHHIRGDQAAKAFDLSQNFSLPHVVSNLFKFLVSIPVLIIRARRMHKPWPWSGFESYLDTPIAEIREEFNIQVLS